MQEVIEQLSVDYGGLTKKGGAFKPKGCITKNKVVKKCDDMLFIFKAIF